MAGVEGLEPTTHGLTVRCSNRLSYTPVNGDKKGHTTQGVILDQPILSPTDTNAIGYTWPIFVLGAVVTPQSGKTVPV